VLVEKPEFPQPVKKFSASCGTRRFIALLTRARNRPFFWARWNHSMIIYVFCHQISMLKFLMLKNQEWRDLGAKRWGYVLASWVIEFRHSASPVQSFTSLNILVLKRTERKPRAVFGDTESQCIMRRIFVVSRGHRGMRSGAQRSRHAVAAGHRGSWAFWKRDGNSRNTRVKAPRRVTPRGQQQVQMGKIAYGV
jgi:hypothetical protein